MDVLTNLSAIRAMDKKTTLLEWITMLVEREFPDAMDWVDEFLPVALASRLSLDDLDNEKKEIDRYMNALDELLQDLRKLAADAKKAEVKEEFPENSKKDGDDAGDKQKDDN